MSCSTRGKGGTLRVSRGNGINFSSSQFVTQDMCTQTTATTSGGVGLVLITVKNCGREVAAAEEVKAVPSAPLDPLAVVSLCCRTTTVLSAGGACLDTVRITVSAVTTQPSATYPAGAIGHHTWNFVDEKVVTGEEAVP